MITLYGKRTSINVRKVLWLLELLDIKYTYIENITKEEINLLNPNGLVPILKDGDFILWESNSILRYLVNKLDKTDYYPKIAIDRAKVDKWIDWQASDFNSSWSYAFQAIVRKSDNYIDKESINISKQKWNSCISIIDKQLEQTKYIASDNFTIADIVIAVSLNRWYLSIGAIGIYKNVDKYFKLLKDKKGFKDIVDNGTA